MTATLILPITSTINPKNTYGLAGEVVTVISERGSVLIVIGKKGAFPVRIDKVIIEKPAYPEP